MDIKEEVAQLIELKLSERQLRKDLEQLIKREIEKAKTTTAGDLRERKLPEI